MTINEFLDQYYSFDDSPELEDLYLIWESKYYQFSSVDQETIFYSLDENNPNDLLLLGFCYRFKGDFDKAIAFFTKAIQLNGTDWRAYTGLAKSLYFTKESQKIAIAEKIIHLCIQVRPEIISAYSLLDSFTNECAFHGDPFYQKIVPLIIEKYKATSFIETGTYLGHSSEFIAKLFPELPIYTTEVNDNFFELASKRLGKYSTITPIKQHTLDFLHHTIGNQNLGERPVFFIDAHWEHDWPLIGELEFIKARYPNAILVIDDMKIPNQPHFPYDNYGGDKVCDLEHIAPVLADLCSFSLIPKYGTDQLKPFTSLSGYGIFALQQDHFLNELMAKNALTNEFDLYNFAHLSTPQEKKRDKKIIGLVAAKNEASIIEFTLKALALFVDSIIIFDDASTDETVSIANRLRKQCKIESIIEHKSWDYNETYYRQSLLNEGRRLGGTHFICLDADEAFTSNLTHNDELRNIIFTLNPGDKLVFNWLQLWRSTLKFRKDQSIWTNNLKVFVFADDGVSNYHEQEFHLLRSPQGLQGKNLVIQQDSIGVMHFQFVNWENLLIKQAWYRCLEFIKDPQKPIQEINERYAPSKDESQLGLAVAPNDWFKHYPFFSPLYFETLETWRSSQVIQWFNEKGKDYFKELDIWDINWDFHANRLAGKGIKTEYNPFTLMQKPVSDAERHILQLVEPMQGWFTDSEKLALFRTVQAQAKDGKILEIGSFMGRSTNAIAHASVNTQREIYALDVWLDFGEDLDDRAQSDNGLFILNSFLKNTQWFLEKLRVLKGSTTQYKYLLSQLEFDLIFVDAAHDYSNVVNDITIALSCIKPNGFMIGHDYHNMGGEEVIQAVHDTLFKYDEIKIKGVFEGTTVWFAQIPEGFKK